MPERKLIITENKNIKQEQIVTIIILWS